MFLKNKILRRQYPLFIKGFFVIFAAFFILFLFYWGYGIYQDLAIIKHINNEKQINSQDAAIYVNGYDWFTRRFYLDVYTGTFDKPQPLHKSSLDLLRRIRIEAITFSGDSINRMDISVFLELDTEYLSFFFEKIEGESVIKVPQRFFKEFELRVSGLNEQDVVSLAENISAESMVIKNQFPYKLIFSPGTLNYILSVNCSKNIVLGGIEIITDNNIQFPPKKSSKHCYQSIKLVNCSPLDEIIRVVKEINTDKLIIFSSTLDCGDFCEKLSAYKFNHAKSVIAEGVSGITKTEDGGTRIDSYSVHVCTDTPL